jgi:hypothetical protein
MIRGGVPEGEAIGTFSYWLDMRGINLWTYFPGEHLPKPVFNVGLKQSLAPGGRQDLASLGIVSRSAGYSPLGQGAGRIVQHNAMVGEAMGLAAALATQNRTTLRRQILEDMPAIQQAQASRYADGKLPLTGHAVWNDETIAQSKALAADNAVVERLLAGMVRAT